ncbi:MAG: hypothetical protein GX633_05725 [Clostridiales bacterium]|nr:hypothetical protein [Clostridiales bacterium]
MADFNKYDPQDIEANKTVSMLAYLIFFLPLLVCPQSKFARFHANQGLLIWIMCFASAVIKIIPIIGGIVSSLIAIAALIFIILGMVNTNKGLAQELPVIGHLQIIK